MSWALLLLSFISLVIGGCSEVTGGHAYVVLVITALTRVVVPLGFAALAVHVYLS